MLDKAMKITASLLLLGIIIFPGTVIPAIINALVKFTYFIQNTFA